MSSRKCIYTNKDADCTDKIIPHDGGDINHNWANSAPCSGEYKKTKGMNLPNELELQINRAFKMLELAKIDVEYWTKKLSELQTELNKTKKPVKEVISKTKKARIKKEIKLAYKEKEVVEVNLDEILEKKKKMEW